MLKRKELNRKVHAYVHPYGCVWVTYQVPGTWYLEPSTRHLVPGPKCQAPGPRYLVPGTGYLVPVPGNRCRTW